MLPCRSTSVFYVTCDTHRRETTTMTTAMTTDALYLLAVVARCPVPSAVERGEGRGISGSTGRVVFFFFFIIRMNCVLQSSYRRVTGRRNFNQGDRSYCTVTGLLWNAPVLAVVALAPLAPIAVSYDPNSGADRESVQSHGRVSMAWNTQGTWSGPVLP